MADAFLDNLVEPDERTAADKQNLLGVDLNVFLVRMFAAALRRDVASAAFKDFQERLLDAFAGNVSRDAYVVRFAANLVDLIDIDDADFRALYVIICILEQAQDDVLDIFADIARFGQCRRVSDAKWNVENLGQRLGQQRFPGAGRAHQ